MISTRRPGTTRYDDVSRDSTHFLELPIIQPVSGVPSTSFNDVAVIARAISFPNETAQNPSRSSVGLVDSPNGLNDLRKTFVTAHPILFTEVPPGDELATMEQPYHQAG